MEPILASAITILILLVASAMAFVTALVRYKRDHAVRLAIVFAIGFLVTAACAAAVANALVDVGAALPDFAKALAYLAVLAVSGLGGGGFASWMYAKRSDESLRRTACGGR